MNFGLEFQDLTGKLCQQLDQFIADNSLFASQV
jgi:hypothetical protein